jgi:hypothetical protein
MEFKLFLQCEGHESGSQEVRDWESLGFTFKERTKKPNFGLDLEPENNPIYKVDTIEQLAEIVRMAKCPVAMSFSEEGEGALIIMNHSRDAD